MNEKSKPFLALLCAALLLALASCRTETPEVKLPDAASSQNAGVSQSEPQAPAQKGEVPQQKEDASQPEGNTSQQTPSTPAAPGQNASAPAATDVDLGWNSFSALTPVDPPSAAVVPETRAIYAHLLEQYLDESAQFTVCDVNNDTLEELVVIHGDTCTVFQHDPDPDFGTACIFEDSADFLFLDNGSAVAPWYRQQGHGGRFWPYVHYRYSPGYQSYLLAGNVDAFDRQVAEDNDFLDLYPQDVDTSGAGFVYYFLDDEGNYSDPVDLSYYREWWDGYFKNASPLKLTLVDLTEASMEAIK